jgi:hypothetical protein
MGGSFKGSGEGTKVLEEGWADGLKDRNRRKLQKIQEKSRSFKGCVDPLRDPLRDRGCWRRGGRMARKIVATKNAENPRKLFEKARSHQEVQNIKGFITKTAQI